jgi:poly(beta-D-mannuronate) lyase
MKRMKKAIYLRTLCFAFLLAWSLPAATGSVYRVKTPAEITTAMTSAQPGDTLLMARGVWNNAAIIFKGNGAEGRPIVLAAEAPGAVILTGASNLRLSGSWLVVDGLRFVGGYSPSGAVIEFRSGTPAYHSRVTNTSIVDYNPANKATDYKWISLFGGYNRVDHCYMAGKTHMGTTLVVWFPYHPHYHLIDHNYFGYRPPLGENGGETIRIGTSDYSMENSRTVVEYNYFETCNGEIEIISNKSCENIYRYNTFVECEGALTLRHGNRCTVEGNFFFGNRNSEAGGVRVIGEEHTIFNNYFSGLYGSSMKSALPIMNGVPDSPLERYFQVKKAVVAFNTFVDCRYPLILGSGSDSERTLPPVDCVIANNVVQGTTKVITQEDEPINLRWEGNIMQGSSLGIPQPVGILLADPQLHPAADGLWRPDSSSPVAGAAAGSYPFVTADMDGQNRAGTLDAGADQLSADPVQRRPMTPADVMPEWMKVPAPVVLTLLKSGSGRVTADPAGGVYEAGSQVTVTAAPDAGWRFDHWEGDAAGGANPLVVTLDQDLVIRAVFVADTPIRFKLDVFVFSSGGKVVLDPPGGSYPANTVVQLTAVPDSGWAFGRWEGALTGGKNPDTLVMNENKMVLGVFARPSRVKSTGDQPTGFRLDQNYPNPFNATTRLSFNTDQPGLVTLAIYSTRGEAVETLVAEELPPGSHAVSWQAESRPSGIYLARLSHRGHSVTKRLLLIK